MLLRALDQQAREEGGAVYMLNGNHESLNLCGNFRSAPHPSRSFLFLRPTPTGHTMSKCRSKGTAKVAARRVLQHRLIVWCPFRLILICIVMVMRLQHSLRSATGHGLSTLVHLRCNMNQSSGSFRDASTDSAQGRV